MTPRRDPRWLSLAILATGLLLVAPVGILAQTSNAVCLSSFNWMDNSKGQSPCTVAAYLQSACTGGQFTVLPLAPNTYYIGPNANQQNGCQCSSVTYSAMCACGLCQNATIISWSEWYFNCSVVYPGIFPPGIPDGTAVPAWAFQNVTQGNTFNITLAQSIGDRPESTAINPQSTVTAIATPTASAHLTASPSASSTSTSSSTPSGSSSKTGAIVGGVVGGVGGAALIAGAIVFFLMKRNRSQVSPSASQPTSSSPYTETTPSAPLAVQPRFYDPSDPTTFPTSLHSATITSGLANNGQSFTEFSSPSLHPGYYSGAPEI